jgi:predicted nucleotidyltransferase component of viral defense system
VIPARPDLSDLADACNESAAREHLQALQVERDFNLTRLIWSIGEELGDNLLLKGGTCLSKVDYGFHRMSEDADFVFPRAKMGSGKDQAAKVMGPLIQKIKKAAEAIGGRLADRPHSLKTIKLQADLTVAYESRFDANELGTILVQIEVRPVLRTPRRVGLQQLLSGPLAKGYDQAYCWALHADEVRAEKVRAAFTREEIRDFYDLQLFISRNSDMDSEAFRALVDEKLKEMETAPLARQHINFGKSRRQIDELQGTIDTLLAVVRIGEDRFELQRVLSHFNELWGLKN